MYLSIMMLSESIQQHQVLIWRKLVEAIRADLNTNRSKCGNFNFQIGFIAKNDLHDIY